MKVLFDWLRRLLSPARLPKRRDCRGPVRLRKFYASRIFHVEADSPSGAIGEIGLPRLRSIWPEVWPPCLLHKLVTTALDDRGSVWRVEAVYERYRTHWTVAAFPLEDDDEV